MAMIMRRFATNLSKNPLATYLSWNIQDVPANKQLIPFTKVYPKIELSSSLLSSETVNGNTPISKSFIASSAFDKQMIDPLVNVKEIIAPSIAANLLKVYQDNPLTIAKVISDPLVNNLKYIEVPTHGKPVKKEAVRMLRIRRRKMKKHKLRKMKKRMRFVLARMEVRKELRKELAFRSELLTQIEEAQDFDAKEYVNGIIHKLRYCPKPETNAEISERLRLLKKKNKSNTVFVKPRFDY